MNWTEILEHSYEVEQEKNCPPESRYGYLADNIFDFTTYDSAMSDLFGEKALDVCIAINDKKTFDYIADEERYRWYLLMVNSTFFAGRLEWGTSIRGAWWDYGPQKLDSCGLWRDGKQLGPLVFAPEEWRELIQSMVEFARQEKT